MVSDHQFRLLFDQTPDSMLALLPDGPRYTVLAANRAYRARAAQRADPVGRGLFEVEPDDRSLRASLDWVARTHQPHSAGLSRVEVDGFGQGARRIQFRSCPVLDDDGGLQLILLCAQDVTDLLVATQRDAKPAGLADVRDEGPCRAHRPSEPTRRVLVVTGRGELRAQLAHALAGRSELSLANDVAEAVAALDAQPDLVLVDSCAAVRALRSLPGARVVPIVALASHLDEGWVAEARLAGADDWLALPITADQLWARVEAHLALGRQRSALTEELARAHQELDAFSYMVSHDLRGPLRAVDGFSALLQEDFGHVLGESGRSTLERVRTNARRMAQLVEALLSLSRIGRTQAVSERVDLSQLAAEVLGDLRREHRLRDVRVHVEAELVVRGDPGLFGVLMANLLGNAWKFTRTQPRACIEVGRAEEPDTFFVRDDGVGFDMATATRLFRPFERLHAREQFEGSGVGLATVRRIVERYGGKLWAESQPGQGATFFFSLPGHVEAVRRASRPDQ